MSYKIEVLENSEIIKVTHECAVTLEQRSLILNELCCDFNLFKRFKLVIDVRNVKKEMSSIEQAIFGQYISSRNELKTALVAILVNITQPVDEVLSNEAFKHGLEIEQFDNEEKAIAWLNN